MTLDETIIHAKETAKKLRAMTSVTNGKPYDECLECAKEHEQIASWLTELQKRRKADKWISVKERMPESRVAVMVYCPERKTQYYAFYADKHWQIFGSYDTVWGNVTHWRPLPKAPESEVKNE